MKVAVREVPTLSIVWFRFVFAFVVLALLVAARDTARLRILVRPPALALVAALALTFNYIAYLHGLSLTTPSFAQILVQVAPLMLAIIGVLLFRERLTRAQALGALVAVIGFSLFYYDQYEAETVSHSNLAMGNLVIFGAAVAWVVYAVLQKILSKRGHAPQDLNLLLYVIPALTLWPWADFAALAALSTGMWCLMIFLGANTLLAYGALGEALKRLPTYQVSVIITLNPLITLSAMATLRAFEVSWVPADNVGLIGYAAALLVIVGVIGVLRRPSSPRLDFE